jgi:hypothetical protein
MNLNTNILALLGKANNNNNKNMICWIPWGWKKCKGVRELESGKQVIQLELDVSHKENI